MSWKSLWSPIFQITAVFCLCVSCEWFGSSMVLKRGGDQPISEFSVTEAVNTAASNIIVVTVETPPAEAESIPNMASYLWTADGQEVSSLHRYSVPWDETFDTNDITMHHYVYMTLNEDLVQGGDYFISTPYGDYEYQFDEQASFCESIKVNQVAYNIHSTSRNAVYGVFLGDGGAFNVPVPEYHIVNSGTGTTVYSGTGDGPVFDEESGENTYSLDLSPVTSEGTYHIYIEGVGRSYDFQINDMHDVAYTVFRGLYHQRCGIALEEPYTKYTRGECHSQVAFTKWDRVAENTGWITIPDNAEWHEIHGGYHDAADYDRREMHTLIPMFMLSYYDIFPHYFTDNQFNIPESGNGIPDYLDEALWGVKLYEYLQLDNTNSSDASEWGGVMSGTEANAHPGWTYSAATDYLEYGTYMVRGHATAIAAGLFAHAARLVRPFDIARANALRARSVAAWNYLQANPAMKIELESQLMYAALQLYLETGDSIYHDDFKQYAQAIIVDGSFSWPREFKPGYVYLDLTENMGMTYSPHFMAYLFTDRDTDAVLKSALREEILSSANNAASGYEAQVYPRGARRASWASFAGLGWTADLFCMAYALTGEQRYFDVVSRLGDFILGLNALGRSFVTGLGDVQLRSPLHLDSYFTLFGVSPHIEPIGVVPGIIIFGPNGRSGMPYQMIVSEKVYPPWDDMPRDRQFADGWSLVNSCEFSTWETIVINVCMYGFLYGRASQ